MAYDAVVFDMDGVLVTGRHTPPAVYREASAAVLSSIGVEPTDPDALADPETVRSTTAGTRFDAETVWKQRELAADERETALIAAGERDRYDDVETLLALDLPLGIVSNNRQGTVEFVVDYFGLPIDAARGRDPTFAGHERTKPDPAYLHEVLDDIGVRAAKSLYVGDRRSDVRTARNAGTDAALLVRDGDPPDGDPDPDHTIRSLRALVDLV